MDIPEIVKAYFDAERRNDPDALATVFAAHAVVRDEGARHEGVGAIRTWWTRAKDKYHHVAEPIAATGAGNTVAVRALVSGTFPNSPVTLDFTFTVADGRVVALEIG